MNFMPMLLTQPFEELNYYLIYFLFVSDNYYNVAISQSKGLGYYNIEHPSLTLLLKRLTRRLVNNFSASGGMAYSASAWSL